MKLSPVIYFKLCIGHFLWYIGKGEDFVLVNTLLICIMDIDCTMNIYDNHTSTNLKIKIKIKSVENMSQKDFVKC